ncbi:MAG: 50S ribosomal protein L9 [Rickettsiaceae bacterium]
MQVILLKSVRKLGKVGDVVNVASGYGRNYLIPQDFAISATKDNLSKFSSLQKQLEQKNNDNKSLAEKAALAIKGKHITFIAQSASDGRLFGSVTAKSLALEVSKLIETIKLNYTNVLLDSPIKFNGVYEIKLILHPEIITSVLVVIAKTESEAQDALNEFLAEQAESTQVQESPN